MLRLPRFTLLTPATVSEAAGMLTEHRAIEEDAAKIGTPGLTVMLVAGGTDLYPNMKRRQFTPQTLIALGRALSRDIRNGSGLRIGAGATLTSVAGDPRVQRGYRALAEAAISVSTPQLRNMGTIGGNLCLDTRCNWYDQSLFWRTAEGMCMKTDPTVVCRVAPSSPRCLAVASADTVPALLALGASVRVANATGERVMPLAELYRDDGLRPLTIGRDDIVTEIVLPPADGWRSTYLKLRDRGSFDFPIVGLAAAVRLEGGIVREARIALTAVGSRPVLVNAAAAALVGTKLEDAAIAAAADAAHKVARPMDNTSGTIAQRKKTVPVFATRALAALRPN
ncbi:MAG TPA: FAD binding domain-containing protein [Candidatus Limnocylindria bacterium]|nr:FAD binding domain-containing protein [Candidatus Limnocylindria bacterium]